MWLDDATKTSMLQLALNRYWAGSVPCEEFTINTLLLVPVKLSPILCFTNILIIISEGWLFDNKACCEQ